MKTLLVGIAVSIAISWTARADAGFVVQTQVVEFEPFGSTTAEYNAFDTALGTLTGVDISAFFEHSGATVTVVNFGNDISGFGVLIAESVELVAPGFYSYTVNGSVVGGGLSSGQSTTVPFPAFNIFTAGSAASLTGYIGVSGPVVVSLTGHEEWVTQPSTPDTGPVDITFGIVRGQVSVTYTYEPAQLQAVPEPTSIASLTAGVLSLLGFGWHRKRAKGAEAEKS